MKASLRLVLRDAAQMKPSELEAIAEGDDATLDKLMYV